MALPAQASYSLSEAEYSAGEAGTGGWVTHLVVGVKSLLQWLQPLLTSANYEVRACACVCVAGAPHGGSACVWRDTLRRRGRGSPGKQQRARRQRRPEQQSAWLALSVGA